MYQGPNVQIPELGAGEGRALLIQTTARIFAYATTASHVDPLQFCRRHSESFKILEIYTVTYTEMVTVRLLFLGFCRVLPLATMPKSVCAVGGGSWSRSFLSTDWAASLLCWE